MTPKLANISVTCPFVTFLDGLGDLFLGLGEAEADRDFCDRLYRSLECELELELSLEEGLGDLLLLRLLLLGFAGSSAVVCAGSWGAGAVALSVDSLGTAVAGAEVSILISGEGFAGGGSAERTGGGFGRRRRRSRGGGLLLRVFGTSIALLGRGLLAVTGSRGGRGRGGIGGRAGGGGRRGTRARPAAGTARRRTV